MQEFHRAQARVGTTDMSIDQGLRSYMLGVYNHMAIAMLISGLVALFAASSPALMQAIFTTPLKWVVMFAPLVFVFAFSMKIMSMSPSAARWTFYAFSAVMGLSISWIFLAFTAVSVLKVFFITAAAFGGLSLYGYTTKRDLSPMGTFLIMGVIGLIIASLANLFFQSSALAFAVNVIGVLIFAGLTAFDTQRIKHTYYQVAGDATMAARTSILGALSLYINFLNLFMFLLQFLGTARE